MSKKSSWHDEDDHEERKIKKEQKSPPNAALFHAEAIPSQTQMTGVCNNTETSPESVAVTLQNLLSQDLQTQTRSAALGDYLMTNGYMFSKMGKADFQQSNSTQNQSHNNHVNMGLGVSNSDLPQSDSFFHDESHMYLLSNMYGQLDQGTSLQPATTSTGNLASTSANQSTANADFPHQILLQGSHINSGTNQQPCWTIVHQEGQPLSKIKTCNKKDIPRRQSATATITSRGHDLQPITCASQQPSASAYLVPVTAGQSLMSVNADIPSTSTATDAVCGNNGTNQEDAAISSTSSAFEGQIDAQANPVSSTSSGAKPDNNSESEKVKDEVYWEKRKKNNESAKRSREARKMKEVELSQYCDQLELENVAMKAQIQLLIHDCQGLEETLFGCQFNNYPAQLFMLNNHNLGQVIPMPDNFNFFFRNHDYQPPPPPPPAPAAGTL